VYSLPSSLLVTVMDIFIWEGIFIFQENALVTVGLFCPLYLHTASRNILDPLKDLAWT
jgi:hypothetical protein